MKKEVSKKDIEKEVLLEGDMSWSDKIKSLLPNFRYNVGGKNALNPFNRKAIRQIDADRKQKLDTIINAAANDILKRMDAHIKTIAPNFPNDPDSKNFITACDHIAQVYEWIVNATKTNPPQLQIDAANKIIRDLSEYVKYFDEVKLAAKYSGLNEDFYGENIELGQEHGLIGELLDSNAKNARSRYKSRTPQGEPKKPKTTKTKQLESLTLPMLLTGIGGSLKGFEWIVNAPWFIDLFKEIIEVPTIETVRRVVLEAANAFTTIGIGEGLTQILNRFVDAGIDIHSSGPEIVEGIAKLGGGDPQKGIDFLCANDGIFANPSGARTVLEELVKNPTGHGAEAQEIFTGTWAGTGGEAGDLLVCKAGGILRKIVYTSLIKTVPIVVFKQAVTYGAGLAVAQGLGAIVAPLGISMVAAGAIVFLFRRKGIKDSRHATLEALYQMIREVPPQPNNQLLLPPGPSQNQISGGKGKRKPDFSKLSADDTEFEPVDEPQGQRQLGQGVTISGGGKERGRPDSNKLDAQDTEFEPVDEPQGQRQLGAGAKRLGTGQSETKPTGQEQPKSKKPYTQLNNSLTNFFKNLLDIRKQGQQNLQEEFEAVKGLRTPQNKVMLNNFIISVKKLRTLAKFINKLSQTNIKNQELNDLIRKIVQNKSHRTIIYISDLLEKSNTDMVNKFIEIYMQYIKSGKNNFRDIQSIIDSQLNEAKNTKDAVITSNTNKLNLKEFNEYFKFYLKDLYQLFALINKLRNTEQKVTTKATTKPVNKQQTTDDDDIYTKANNAYSLEEGKKKKTKYSKKASEFIGKEISHLKKDKGYPQDKAVAAAINVAKDKGMKVGAKKKKKKISEEAPTIAPPKPKTPTTVPTTVPTTPYRPKTKTPPKAGKEQLPNWLSFKSLGLN
jgi:hypothetical protein